MKLGALSVLALGLSTNCLAEPISGELSVMVADYADGSAKYSYFLDTDQTRIELTGAKVAELPMMSEIEIEADVTFNGASEGSHASAQLNSFTLVKPLAESMAERERDFITERRAVAILVDFNTKKVPTTTEKWPGLWQRMDEYYKTASLNQISFPTDTDRNGKPDIYTGSFTGSETACDYGGAYYAGRAAAIKAGMRGDYQHEMYVLPKSIGCGWLGLAYVGCRDRCILWTSSDDNLTVLAHEMGHNLGMHHASRDVNDDNVVESEYGDHSDVMGNYFDFAVGLNAPHVEQMGWAAKAKPRWIRDHVCPRPYELNALALPEATLAQAVKWRRPKGGYYYLSYRGGVGADARLKPEFKDKLNINYWGGANQSKFVTAIGPGQKVSIGGMPIRFEKVTGNVATVTVGEFDATCVE